MKSKFSMLFVIIFFLFIPFISSGASVSYNWKNVIIGGGGFVTGIVYHPAESGLVYARTDMGGAYRWDNSLGRWVAITDMMNRNNSDYMGILSIAVDPTDTNRVYLMTGKYTDSWAGNGAVLVSTNRGNSWTIVPLSFKVGGNEEGRG
ncbi:MAG TPA: endoglucanase, partial [Candidatus Goldiibacteriota bacterium]|nr:endoglucanase [Candidatus Goldiibacteriota bacterium]